MDYNNTMIDLLKGIRNIAVVGLSDNPDRPSFAVAKYLQNSGFQVIPVNPKLSSWEDLVCYPSLEVARKDNQIDLVDIFRRSEEVGHIVQEVIGIGDVKVIWMQEGVTDVEARNLAVKNGIIVVMDTCIMKCHHALSEK